MGAGNGLDVRQYIEAFRGLPTGNISDALDELCLEGSVAVALHPFDRTLPTMVGVAVTVQQGPRVAGAGRAHLTRHADVMEKVAGPGDVMVIAVGGRVDVCSWGGILCLRAKRRGLAGVVIDGAARDVDEIIKSQFPVFAKGATPRASHVSLDTLSVNQPVECAGVQVRPGDLVVGDSTGVVFIPAEHAEKVLKAAQAVKAREEKILASLR